MKALKSGIDNKYVNGAVSFYAAHQNAAALLTCAGVLAAVAYDMGAAFGVKKYVTNAKAENKKVWEKAGLPDFSGAAWNKGWNKQYRSFGAVCNTAALGFAGAALYMTVMKQCSPKYNALFMGLAILSTLITRLSYGKLKVWDRSGVVADPKGKGKELESGMTIDTLFSDKENGILITFLALMGDGEIEEKVARLNAVLAVFGIEEKVELTNDGKGGDISYKNLFSDKVVNGALKRGEGDAITKKVDDLVADQGDDDKVPYATQLVADMALLNRAYAEHVNAKVVAGKGK